MGVVAFSDVPGPKDRRIRIPPEVWNASRMSGCAIVKVELVEGGAVLLTPCEAVPSAEARGE